MKNNKFTTIFTALLALAPLIGYGVLYSKLPQQVPMHYDFYGNVDRYGSKLELLLIPILVIGIHFMFQFMPKIDPKGENYKKFGKFYSMFHIATLLLLDIVFLSTIIDSLYPNIVKINYIVPILIGVLFIFIGNYMPQTKQNFFFGVKTPWTISNEVVWNKTNRLSGYLFMILGVITIITPFLTESAMIVFIIGSITIAIVPIIMSYIYYRQETKK